MRGGCLPQEAEENRVIDGRFAHQGAAAGED
jgi:hypothetical protein